ncbi:hypothetical protein Ndes2437A_g04043 [Nannochloris sp. 'desiccata']
MVGRHLLESSSSYIYIPIGSIIGIVLLIFYSLCKCAEKRAAAAAEQDRSNEPAGDIEAQATTPYRAQSNSTTNYPQFASTTHSSGVVHVPALAVFDGYSPGRNPFTRAQIEAMSVDELKILKERLNMEHLGPIPRDEFVDMALAVQTSLAQQASSPSASLPPQAPSSKTWGRTGSLSSRNPETGLMQCGICSEEMGGGAEKSMAAAPCGHAYCYDCLVQVRNAPGTMAPSKLLFFAAMCIALCAGHGVAASSAALSEYTTTTTGSPEEGTLNYMCEIPKETTAKFELITDEVYNPIKQDIKDDKLRFYPYNINWNYGMLPQTWEDPEEEDPNVLNAGGDNDPVDVVEIGNVACQTGGIYKIKPLCAFAMVDEGEVDWKIIAIRTDDPNAAEVNDVEDIERVFPGELEKIRTWFTNYKIPDGKPANQFGYDGQCLNKEFAMGVIEETHGSYNELRSGARANTEEFSLI